MTSSFVDTVTADDDDIEEDIDERKTSRKQRYFSVFLFTTTSAFLYADQNLLSPNLSQAAEEFNFSDREKDVKLAGWLQLAFFVVGSPASLIIGWMCDKTESRVRLLFLTTLIGEGPCLATYWVTKYWQLFMLRAMTGIAVGGCLPLLFSLCGDLFSHKTRAKVASFLTIATGAGIAFGQIMSGAVGPKYGWKVPFVVSAAVGFLCSLSYRPASRAAMLEQQVVPSLVPVIRKDSTEHNSMSAVLVAANVAGHLPQERRPAPRDRVETRPSVRTRSDEGVACTQSTRRLAPQLTYVGYPTSHFVMLDAPVAVNARIRRWVQGLQLLALPAPSQHAHVARRTAMPPARANS